MNEHDQLKERAALEWLDIATAPKDGTRVLLAWDDVMMHVGFWHPRENAWIDTHHVLHNQHSLPTHWMPLPEPPK